MLVRAESAEGGVGAVSTHLVMLNLFQHPCLTGGAWVRAETQSTRRMLLGHLL
jgi:hypothetical protein